MSGYCPYKSKIYECDTKYFSGLRNIFITSLFGKSPGRKKKQKVTNNLIKKIMEGMYSSHAFNKYAISKEIYNYLLPVYSIDGIMSHHGTLINRNIGGVEYYYFIGSDFDYKYMQNLCKYIN